MLTKQKLPRSVLLNILNQYDLGKTKEIKPVSTSGNITFLITADSGKYILRLCPEGDRWRSQEEINAELELIDYLNNYDFPAPCPVAKRDGQRVIEYENKFGYLRKYDLGKAVLRPNSNQVYQFGKIIGWFHGLIEDYQTKNKREHIWDLKATQENFLEAKEDILKSSFPQVNDFVAKLERELFALSFPDQLLKGMIHEDLGKRHILWQNNKISCILDFDRCYYGKLVLDLGQALRGWSFIDNWHKWSKRNFEILISGYQSKRKLTKLEKEYLIDAVKFGVLERSLSFCLRFIKTTQDIKDEEFAQRSLFNLINLIEDNREKINKFLK